jgi:retinoid hydroxylase
MSHLAASKAIRNVSFPVDYQRRSALFLAQMYEQHGPVFRAPSLFGQEITYLIGPTANYFVLVSHRHKFSNGEGWGRLLGLADLYGKGLGTIDGAEHAQHRRLMTPAFAAGYMSRYLPVINCIIREHLAMWPRSSEIDIHAASQQIVFDISAKTLAGLSIQSEIDRFHSLYTQINTLVDCVDDEVTYAARLQQLHDDLYVLLEPRIAERRQQPTDDILSMLVHTRDTDGRMLSDTELVAYTNDLLIVGYENTTSLASWLLHSLSKYPAYLQRVVNELEQLLGPNGDPTPETLKSMKVLDNALQEVGRLTPPVTQGPRGVLEDVEFQGHLLPAGSYMFYSIAASHLLPSIFTNPLIFDPDRFAPPREEHKKQPYALVTFGGGPRICIGMHFAQAQIKAMAAHILRQYRLEVVPGQQPVQIYGAVGQRPNGLKMFVSAYT